jgi:hypothetical protein
LADAVCHGPIVPGSCEKIDKRAAERRSEISPGPAKRSPGLEVNLIESPEGATEDH